MNISDINQRVKFPYHKVQPYGKWELSVIFEMPINDIDIFSVSLGILVKDHIFNFTESVFPSVSCNCSFSGIISNIHSI